MQATNDSVLVIGASGMLARAFAALLERGAARYHMIDLPEIDLADEASVERCVDDAWRVVINCAAFTDVDGAETREELANAINGTGVGTLARRCASTGARLVHYSTDYVFDGCATEPYAVDHPHAPINAYGRSKALGERLLTESGARHLLLRTSWLYAPWGKNFVLTMRELLRTRELVKVVDDQIGRPTSAEYLAERTLGLLQRGATGVFHVTDGGQCSWYGLAQWIAQQLDVRCLVVPVTSDQFLSPAKRPAYSVLDIQSTEALLGPSRPWQENVRQVLLAAKPAL